MKFTFTKKQYFLILVSSVILLSIFLLAVIVDAISVSAADYDLFSRKISIILKISFFVVSLQLILTLLQSNFISDIISVSKLDVTGTNTKYELEYKLNSLEENGNIRNVGIIMLDINDLKYINDHFGHDEGDKIILNFAHLIKKSADRDVFVARFGGDEFICIDENATISKIKEFQERLNSFVFEFNQSNEIKISYAFGFEINSQEPPLSIHELFRAADQNMYRNKRAIKSEDVRFAGKKDSVTGLLSNENFAQIFEDNIKDSIDFRQLAVDFTDFSNFRYINELSGKSKGDSVLKAFAMNLLESRNTICSCRLFSDYFVSLLDVTGLSEREIESLIYLRNKVVEEQVRKQFRLSAFNINSGIYLVNRSVSSVAEMVQFANVARNNARINNTGVCLYSSEIDAFERKKQEILTAFKTALKNDEFAVYLQPKISASDDTIGGVEALSRWTFNGEVRWTPDEYIPALETSGDIILLDYYVYDKIFEWLSKRSKTGLGYIKISLNVSPVHLNNPSLFFEYIKKLESKYMVPAEYISFELSETAYMQKKETVSLFIQVLHKRGFKISLDDFKSGYSSLKSLEDVPFDEVKINPGFADDKVSFSDRMILKSVISMIKEMDKVVVCQGIENKGQIDFLKNEKCDLIQGFYYSKPIPIDSFNEFVHQFHKVG